MTEKKAKSLVKRKPKDPIKDIKDFLKYVERYWDETRKSNFPRYMSWEHCYERFQASYSKVIAGEIIDNQEKDSLCLWLAWYLASWGMYRGSSDLLCHSYEVHRKVIEILLDKRWCCLNNVKCENWTDDMWEMLGVLRKELSDGYENKVSVTDTLFTKILLGTLGCTPAFDGLFENSVSFNSGNKGLLKEHFRKFQSLSMTELCKFYNEVLSNPEARCLNKMMTKEKKLPYPQMKILDMGFWNFWKTETNNKEA